MSSTLLRRPAGCASDLTIDRWLLGDLASGAQGQKLEAHFRSCGPCGSRARSLKELYAHQRTGHPGPRTPPLGLSAAPALTFDQRGVAQIIILRDGLLVGTEVFTPGEWLVGSDPRADLVLTDSSVAPRHARLVFRGQKACIEDLGGGLFANGFKVARCEVRPIDEVACGPYLLRVRVIAERWSEQPAPVDALRPLGSLPLEEHVTQPNPQVTQPSARRAQPKTEPVAIPEVVPRPAAGAHLELRLFWGDVLRDSRVFGAGGPVIAAERESAAMPLWGFGLGAKDFVLADGLDLFVPPRVTVERRGPNGWEKLPACASVRVDAPIRLRSEAMTLVATPVAPAVKLEAPKRSAEGWPVLALSAVLLAGLLSFVHAFAPDDDADFVPRPMPRATFRPVFEQKKPRPKTQDKAVAADKTAKPTRDPAPARPPSRRPPLDPLDGALAVLRHNPLDKIGAALDRIGKRGGRPVAGIGSIGLPAQPSPDGVLGFGGNSPVGIGRNGARDAGNLRLGNLGKGMVGAQVDVPTVRRVGSSPGSVDRDKVAKVINAHLGEVQACYERALLKQPSLHGKVLLEWVISLSGEVRSARTRSSTLKSPDVESCILGRLKGWRFPSPKGGEVTVTYPFMFEASSF